MKPREVTDEVRREVQAKPARSVGEADGMVSKYLNNYFSTTLIVTESLFSLRSNTSRRVATLLVTKSHFSMVYKVFKGGPPMPDFGFQNLDTYHLAKMLVIETYKTTDTFSNSEKYGLSQQMNRAAVSIPSNIAEGYAREGSKDKCHFLNIAYGSLMELVCQFEIAWELDFVEEEKYQDFKNKAFKLAIKISKFRNYLSKK